jgi:hypothetical protein
MPRSTSNVLERSLTTEILYGRAEDHLRVFVSSKMRDGTLAGERRTAVRVIDSHPWHRAWSWETSAESGPYSARRVCIANAQTSDALLLIVADELTSITKSEYLAAKRSGVPRFILVKSNAVQTPELKQFLDRERARTLVTVPFGNMSEFRTRIKGALRTYALRAHRESIVRRRSVPR